jgi:uncharacterized protein
MVFVIYIDNAGEYRWRLFSSNQRIIADSGEGYVQKSDCLHGIRLVQGSWSASVQDQS